MRTTAGAEDPGTDYFPPFDDLETCDLVMKGGVTSGVVYPPAVFELARKTYRFRSIGGTSAGAIAAGVVAAAERGRLREYERLDQDHRADPMRHLRARHTAGFAALEQVIERLRGEGQLVNLFQPDPGARPLFNVLLDGLQWYEQLRASKKPLPPLPHIVQVIRPLLIKHNPETAAAGAWSWGGFGMAVGAGLGLALGALAVTIVLIAGATLGTAFDGRVELSLLIMLIALSLLGAIAGLVVGSRVGAPMAVVQATLRQATRGLRENMYGLCGGRTVEDHRAHAVVATRGSVDGLTDWLHTTIQTVSGAGDGPLTFGDLGEPEDEREWHFQDKDSRKIQLRMVTTDLSQRKPYVLPRLNGDALYFSEEEMARLFPPDVVAHLIAHSDSAEDRNRYVGGVGPSGAWRIPIEVGGVTYSLHRLPGPLQLPVLVAVRMSLSFPLLLSAVPLWTIRPSDTSAAAAAGGAPQPRSLAEHDAERHWFSDGGICSNFPIHFFDKWFPDSPTFGINLDDPDTGGRAVTDQAPLGSEEPSMELLLKHYREQVHLPIGQDQLQPRVYAIDSVFTFLRSILTTSLNYRDTLQSQLPSYRERIVNIELMPSEGGLNLNMSPDTIATITQKGMLAGMLLRERFNMEHHKWIRMRLLIEELTEQMQVLKNDLVDTDLAPPDWAAVQSMLQHALVPVEQSDTKVRQLLIAERSGGGAFPLSRDNRDQPQDVQRLYLLLLLIAAWGDKDQPEFFGGRKFSWSHVALRVTPDL